MTLATFGKKIVIYTTKKGWKVSFPKGKKTKLKPKPKTKLKKKK